MTDDEMREKIWHEINEAWPQLADAMLSRLTEILWPNGKFHNPSEPWARPLRFYPDDDEKSALTADPHNYYPYRSMAIQVDGSGTIPTEGEE